MSIYLPKYCISLALLPTLTDKERKVYDTITKDMYDTIQ